MACLASIAIWMCPFCLSSAYALFQLDWGRKSTGEASLSLSGVKTSRTQGVQALCTGKMMWCHSRHQWAGIPEGRCVGRIPYLDSHLRSPHKLKSLIPGISSLSLLLLTTSLTLLERPGPIPGASWDMIQFQHLTKIAQDQGEPRRAWFPLQSIGQGCNACDNAKTVIKLTKSQPTLH